MKNAPEHPNESIPSESLRQMIRRQALERAREREDITTGNQVIMSPEEIQRTLFELQVHQIELEMQNEELRRVQSELAAERARYYDLFDLAPVGYATLAQDGLILETNQTADTMFGMPRGAMAGQQISRLIFREDQDIYYIHREQLIETGEPQKFELRLVKNDGTLFWGQMWAVIVSGSGGLPVSRIAVSDITDRKNADEAVSRAKEEISAALIAKKQMSVLQSQIKPHFLYNALNAIISLCYTDGAKAGALLTRFSQYLRIVFDYNSQEEMVPLQKELELVKVYSDIEKVRYGERLKTAIDVDSTLLDQNIMSLILQPLVENAIRHGVSKKIKGGTVRLRIKRCGSFIKVTVNDNGVGMSKTMIQQIMERDCTEAGVGIANINQRLLIKTGKKLMIRSTEGAGTTIMLYLPLHEGDQMAAD